jgi:hypothetical protein
MQRRLATGGPPLAELADSLIHGFEDPGFVMKDSGLSGLVQELAEKLTLSRKKEEGKRKTLRFSAFFLLPFSFRLSFSAAC